MFVRPAEGRAVRVPHSPRPRRLLAAAGEMVPDTHFWRRRVRDKDVIVCKPPVEPVTGPPSAAQPDTAVAPEPPPPGSSPTAEPPPAEALAPPAEPAAAAPAAAAPPAPTETVAPAQEH